VATQIIVQRTHKTPIQHAPVSVLVADFTNHTGDAAFDGTLEPMFNVALEGASFINAYNRGSARKLAQKLPSPTDKLDEQPARLVAVSEGISTVITGEISRHGNKYTVSVRALDAATGKPLAKAEATSTNKNEVVGTIPKLVAPIRKALGDAKPESAQLEAARGTVTAASLEAVHQYGIGMEQQAAGRRQEAIASFAKTAELDPGFARAYSGMAANFMVLNKLQDADKYVKLAMQHEDRMTDRERYRMRGLYYFVEGNYQKCIEEYTELVNRYPVDNIGQGNLAACYIRLRNPAKAVEAERRAVDIVPKNAVLRLYLSFYTSYGGDFQGGEREARAALALSPSPECYLALAEAQVGGGQLSQAAETYKSLEKLSALGASMAASGFADLAVYEGRFADAVRILEQGAAADLAAKNPENAADKFAALGQTQLLRGQNRAALAAAQKALANSKSIKVRFLAGQNFVAVGQSAKAQKLAATLGSEMTSEPQAYAKIIEGDMFLKQGNTREAFKAFMEANKLLDTWIGHLELGRAYLQSGLFVEADSEFDRCVKRRGEALELFMDNVPTFGYFPAVYYLQGRVREGLKSPRFAESYRNYLSIRGQAGEDPLLPEIRRRLGQYE
jgi:tetratricopeptide (TPR) repeat protein